ncbi:MAG: hypothetical protein HY744_20275 [Deltaproteobacteria bacterium]|nr:hypothetical protein [Deltaproteobacteria bacterium]
MSTHKPIGDLRLVGRTPEDEQRDARALAAAEAFVPDLTERVCTYLREQTGKAVAASLGDLAAFADALAALAAESGGKIDAAALARDLEDEAKAIGAGAAPDPQDVEDEAVHACREFTRHWLDLLVGAWHLWGKPETGVVLDSNLLPDRSTCPESARAEWEELAAESKCTLRASAALSADDLAEITPIACKNVRSELDRGLGVAVPDGLELRQIGNDVRLLRA